MAQEHPTSPVRSRYRGALFAAAIALSATLLASNARAENRPPWLGVALEPSDAGVRIRRVIRRSPAESAGLHTGDIVKRIGETPIKSPSDLTSTIARRAPGEKIEITLIRDAKETKLHVTLSAKVLAADLVGKFLPPLELETLKGETVKQEELSGKVTLVYLFATWCGSCRATMPKISAWQTKFAARGFRTVGIGTDTKADVKAYAEQAGTTFPIGVTEDALPRFGVDAIPTLFLVDRRGVVRDVLVGADPAGLARIEASLPTLLGEATGL